MAFDLDNFLAVTRLSGLVVGPGDRLAVGASTPSADGKGWLTEIRAIDAAAATARRLVAPAAGNRAAAYTRAGDLLFVAKRDDVEAPDAEKVGEASSLWSLPADGGEARRVFSAPAGVGAVAAARDADVVVVAVDVFPAATSLQHDRELGEARDKAGVSAYLWDDYPIRYWDSPLAPRKPRLLVLDGAGAEPRDLTGNVGNALQQQGFVLSPDGRTVYTGWSTPTGLGELRVEVVAIDVATGERRTIAGDPSDAYEFSGPVVSPDGRLLACVRERVSRPDLPPALAAWLVDLSTGEGRVVGAELDAWPTGLAFAADSAALLVSVDEKGQAPVHRVPVDGTPAERVTADGAFANVVAGWSGDTVFALRSGILTPPEVVRVAGGDTAVLHSEGFATPTDARLEEVRTTAADGTPLRAWLVLPAEAGADAPVPLVLFIHGGPLSSWNGWHWRWQSGLLAARGLGVLLPDPALSTGYGQAMVDRGWGQWGGTPWDDVLALTDAALERPDLDASRTAVTGGSYGGYLTNWAITHIDRFTCAMTHASIWELTGFRGTTDSATWWEKEFGHPRRDAEFYRTWSPATYADAVSTPTLVIHGEQDFRVPVGEGLALYTELQRSGVESQLLYFPDENHWVLKPGNIRVWYDVVLSWLERWLLGAEPTRPATV